MLRDLATLVIVVVLFAAAGWCVTHLRIDIADQAPPVTIAPSPSAGG